MIPLTHRGRVNLDLSELATLIQPLRAGIVDRVIFHVGLGYLIIKPKDLPAVGQFIDGTSDTLALPGGILPDTAVGR